MTAHASSPSKSIERNIWFYRIFTEEDDGAINSIPRETIPKLIAKLSTRTSRYMPYGTAVGLECEAIANHSDRLRMIKVIWDDHPTKYSLESGSEDLDLEDEEGLSDPTHVRFFDHNIVGIDMNRRGPFPTALGDYVRDRFPTQFGTFRMRRVPDRDAMERLKRMSTIKSASIKLSEKSLLSLPTSITFMDTLKDLWALGGTPGVFEIAWRLFRNNGHLNADAFKALVIALTEHGEDLDKTAQIIVEGADQHGAPQTYNLKSDYLFSPQSISRGEGRRSVDSTDAFRKIAVAYNGVLKRLPPQDFIQD